MKHSDKSSSTSSAQPNRRHFLIGAGSLAFGAAAGPSVMAGMGSNSGNRKAGKYGMVQEGKSVLEKFQLTKELGFDGIELHAPSSLDLDEVNEAAKATGLIVHGVVDSVHWKMPFSHPKASVRKLGVEALEKALRDCKAVGGSTVLIVPAVVSKEVSYSQAWQRSTVEIAKALPLAEELGVKLAIENVWNNFLLSPLEMAQYIDSFNSKMIGAYLDVGNLVRYAWPEHWVEALGHRIMKIDVKGYSRKLQDQKGPWKGFDVGIGDGDCDWKAVNAALRKTGFEGWYTAEVGGGDGKRLKEIAAAMDRIMSA